MEPGSLSLVLRVGPRAAARAGWRRLRALARPGADLRLDPASVVRFARALRIAPSAICEDGDRIIGEALEAAEPGVRARIRARARAAADTVDRLIVRPEPGEDPRSAWERHRLLPLVWIAAGLRATDDPWEEGHLRASFEGALRAWVEANPPGSPAWASPLELSVRAWNLWVALSLARPATLADDTLVAASEALVRHARLIVARREDDGLVVGTHLLGELVGLWACGVALGAGGEEPARWRAWAQRGLRREVRRQVQVDGAGTEGSTGYTRFVGELLVAAGRCAVARGRTAPAWLLGARDRVLG